MPTTTFDPAIHGFRFGNRFVNVVVSLPGVPKMRTKGRCGGMAYAALDYFTLLRAAPKFAPEPPARVPPDGHPLADYLLRRQLDSFHNDSALRFVTWTVFPDENLPFAKGVRRWTAEEIPRAEGGDRQRQAGGHRAGRSPIARRCRPPQSSSGRVRLQRRCRRRRRAHLRPEHPRCDRRAALAQGRTAHPGVEPTRPPMARTVRARLRRASASEGGRLRSGGQAMASRSAAAANSRVESRVGSGDSAGPTSNGISVQANATASQPRSPRRTITRW